MNYFFKYIFIFTAFTFSVNADYLNDKIVFFPIKKTELATIVNSTIKKINFRSGESFNKDDTLIELDNRYYKELFEKSKADVLRTQEAYKYNNTIYIHNKTLFQKEAIGEQELQESKLNMIKALAESEQAKANYKISELNLSSCLIKAPFSGIVISELENEYDYVREGQPIIEIADDSKLLAVLNLPSDVIKKIKTGIKLSFHIDEINENVEGTIYTISGSINPGSRTFEVKALVDNSSRILRIGMSGSLLTKL